MVIGLAAGFSASAASASAIRARIRQAWRLNKIARTALPSLSCLKRLGKAWGVRVSRKLGLQLQVRARLRYPLDLSANST